MANSVTTNPITIDTAGVISTEPVTIKAIQVRFTAATNVVLLSDADGALVYESVATAEKLTDCLTVPGGIKLTKGLTATTIDGASTVVYLYLK